MIAIKIFIIFALAIAVAASVAYFYWFIRVLVGLVRHEEWARDHVVDITRF